MSRRGDPGRYLIAARPPRSVVRSLLDAIDVMDLPAHERVAEDRVRLVIQHAKRSPKGGDEALIESVQRAASGLAPFDATPVLLISAPADEPARSVEAVLEAPATLYELKRRLAQRLARRPRRDPADRFTPRMTLARFNGPKEIEPIEKPVVADSFAVDRLEILRVVQTPGGAQEKRLGEIILDA